MRTILLLTVSNVFMTFAWYGHLRLREQFRWNYVIAFALIVAAVFFMFYE